MLKRCCKCGIEKPLTDFYFRRPTLRNKRGVYSSDCRECIKTWRKERYHGNPEIRAKAIAYSARWKRENPEALARSTAKPENRASKKRWHLARVYGLSVSEFQGLLDKQGNACAICRKPFGDIVACVDHDHATGAVRGILCHRCNRAIGLLGDSVELATAAARYLKTLA